MLKLDLAKRYTSYYTAKATPEIVQIEKAQFMCLQGKGDPNAHTFTVDIEALYSTAYALKFACKADNNDFTVAKLEALWWFDTDGMPEVNMYNAPTLIPRSEWEYELMIRLPEFVHEEMLETAREKTFNKKQNERIKEIRFKEIEEGKCVQILHIGPFATEPVSLKLMDNFMRSHQLSQNGKHHEIYLSDFRKTASEKLRTILREPVR